MEDEWRENPSVCLCALSATGGQVWLMLGDQGDFPRRGKKFSTVWKMGDSGGMNTFLSAAMILWIFGMVIYLTKDM